jgi:hypothetical protein
LGYGGDNGYQGELASPAMGGDLRSINVQGPAFSGGLADGTEPGRENTAPETTASPADTAGRFGFQTSAMDAASIDPSLTTRNVNRLNADGTLTSIPGRASITGIYGVYSALRDAGYTDAAARAMTQTFMAEDPSLDANRHQTDFVASTGQRFPAMGLATWGRDRLNNLNAQEEDLANTVPGQAAFARSESLSGLHGVANPSVDQAVRGFEVPADKQAAINRANGYGPGRQRGNRRIRWLQRAKRHQSRAHVVSRCAGSGWKRDYRSTTARGLAGLPANIANALHAAFGQ